MKNLCIILARGGSKGLPDKNILPFGGKPLIAHTIAAAKDSNAFAHVFVSSDHEPILRAATDHGADIIRRPDALASDTSSSVDALLHALAEAEKTQAVTYDTVCLLQPTSPLRNAADIRAAYALFSEKNPPSLFSVCISHASPYFNMVETTGNKIALSKSLPHGITRRQDAPQTYQLNGALYIWKKEALLEHKKVIFADSAFYVMPQERSADIDNRLDFDMAEFLFKKLHAE